MRRKSKKGMTRMEMMIVLCVGLVLIAIAVPAVLFSIEKARDSAAKADIASMEGTVHAAAKLQEKQPAELQTGEALLLYENGAFTNLRPQEDGSFSESFLQGMVACDFQANKTDCYIVRVQMYQQEDKLQTVCTIMYSAKGRKDGNLVRPYYTYDSFAGTTVKNT